MKMGKEIIGIYEGAVGLMLVVSLFGWLTEFVIIFGVMLAVPSLVRALYVITGHRKKRADAVVEA